MKADVEEIGKELEDIEGRLKEAEGEAKKASEIETRLKQIGKPEIGVAKVKGLLQAGKDEISEIEGKKRVLGKEVERIGEDLKTCEAAEELKQVVGKLERNEKGLKEVGFEKAEYEKLKNGFDSIIERWRAASSGYEGAKAALDGYRGELKRLKAQEKVMAGHQAEVERLDAGQEFLLKFKNALGVVQEKLRQEFVSGLNSTMHQLWEGIYPYDDFTSIRLGIVDGDYVLQLRLGEEWVDVEGIVSGGERSSAALVLRMSFALVLAPHLRMLILNEPTHNLDKKGVEELATTLRERVGEYINQVFLITHEEGLEEAVSGNLYRLEREKAGSMPTSVELAEKY